MNKPKILQILGPYHLPHAEILQNYMGEPICRHKGDRVLFAEGSTG